MTAIRDNTRIQATTDTVLGIFERRKRRKFFLDLNIHPRSHPMKRAVINFLLPVLALAAIGTAIAFPKPNDLQTALVEATSPLQQAVVVNPEPSDVRPFIDDYAKIIPGLQSAVDADADCFVGLDQATAAKLRRCAPAVTEIVAQIVAYQDNPQVQRILNEGQNQRLVQQLQVAATEVCRSIWATGSTMDHGLDSPVCLVAQVQLAPSRNP